jgi:uncharacterized protein
MGVYIIVIVLMLVGWLISMQLKRKFRQYSEVTIGTGMSGKDIAEKMLSDNGIKDVRVISVDGKLTDHYNPLDKTVNLSHDVYYGHSAAAAAVSAHECGHAVQHAQAYTWLQLRSALVPVVSFGSKWVQWILLAGIFTLKIFPGLMLAGIVMFAAITVFSFITLPVEFDASKRALVWLRTSKTANTNELTMAKDALSWAAMTYVVAALSALATLAYYIMVYSSGRRD